MNKTRMHKPAYSLVFAFMIMTIVMIMASTAIGNTQDKLQQFQDIEGNSMARLAAESAAEQALVLMKNSDPGYQPYNSATDLFTTDKSTGQVMIYSQGRSNSNTGYYSVPIPGTGNAAPSDDCSIFDNIDGSDEVAAHPCNWNKLLFGQSVSIPLYTYDNSGGCAADTCVPADSIMGFNSWRLKVRTPCENGSYTSDCVDGDSSTSDDRYAFDDTMTDDTVSTAGDDSVVFWQLIATKSDGSTETVIPDDSESQDTRGTPPYSWEKSSNNTEIYESSINDAASSSTDTYVTLEMDSSSSNSDAYDLSIDSDVVELILQLDIILPLIDDASSYIPHLEWQLEIDGTYPFAEQKAVIVGEGYHEGSEHTFYYPYVITNALTSESSNIYTLSN